MASLYRRKFTPLILLPAAVICTVGGFRLADGPDGTLPSWVFFLAAAAIFGWAIAWAASNWQHGRPSR